MVDFHGYELPIWYSSIQEEHLSTRNSAGLFDVSHMGLFRFLGDGVRTWLSSVSTQEYMKFQPGRCGYTHFLDHEGNIIDDMIFAVSNEAEVLGVPNSTMVTTVMGWLSSNLPQDGSVVIEDLSDQTSIIALQGPNSGKILGDILGEENDVQRFRCQEIMTNGLGLSGWIQGTGYTGEKGVEIFIQNEDSRRLWDALLSHPDSVPVGLGARDTLRLEKGYLLSGQDFSGPVLRMGTMFSREDSYRGPHCKRQFPLVWTLITTSSGKRRWSVQWKASHYSGAWNAWKEGHRHDPDIG